MTMPIWRRRLSCVTARISCPSIAIVPCLGIEEAQQRLTSVDLPVPERPTRPTFSPGAIAQRHTVEPAVVLAVVMADSSKRIAATRGASGQAHRRIDDVERLGDGLERLAHRAEMAEQDETASSSHSAMAVMRKLSASEAAISPSGARPDCHSDQR